MTVPPVLTPLIEEARVAEPTPAEVAAVVRRVRGSEPEGHWPTRLVVVLAALLVAAGAATATLLTRDDELDRRLELSGPLRSSGDRALDRLIAKARTRRSLAPVADTFSAETLVPDPDGGLPWVLVVWRTQTGGWCNVAARQRGSEFGVVTDTGRFTAFPFQEGGACTRRALPSDQATFAVRSHPGGPTVVHGVAGAEVQRLRVRGLPGLSELVPSQRGGFLAVLDADIRHPEFVVEAELRDGSRVKIAG